MAYQMYRTTSVGNALEDTLDELIQKGKIRPELALKVMRQFDKTINAALPEQETGNLTFTAQKLNTYRFCDGVWTLILDDVQFRQLPELGVVEKIKIVACDGVKEEEKKKQKEEKKKKRKMGGNRGRKQPAGSNG